MPYLKWRFSASKGRARLQGSSRKKELIEKRVTTLRNKGWKVRVYSAG